MEDDSFYKDDFLRKLVGKSSREGPSDDFTEKVMSRIQLRPEILPVKKSFFLLLKSSIIYFLLAAILVGFFLTSDLSFMNRIPGKEYMIKTFSSFFSSLVAGLKSMPGSSKSFSIPIMIIVASGVFFLLDKFLVYRNTTKNQPTI